MPKKSINYNEVASLCNELANNGENPTQRKIQQRLGGSFSTLLPFFQQWQEERMLSNLSNESFSDTFRQAVLAEFTRITTKTRAQLETQLEEEKKCTKETQALLQESDIKLKQALEQLELINAKIMEGQLKIAAETAVTRARSEDFEKREKNYLQELKELRMQLQQAERQMIKAEAELEQLKRTGK